MKRWVLFVIVVGLGAAFMTGTPAAHAVPESHIPGVFAVSIKGELPGTSITEDRRQMGRLALYDFKADGTITEHFWAWNTASDYPASEWGSTNNNFCITYVGVPVGTIAQPDSSTAPVCRANFHDNINTSAQEGEPQTLTGTYQNLTHPSASVQDGDILEITWPGTAGVERWRYAFSTEKLAKIEMVYFSKFNDPNDFYGAPADLDDRTDTQNINAGWGWGAAGTTLRGRQSMQQILTALDADQSRTLVGCEKFWNNFNKIPTPAEAPAPDPAMPGRELTTVNNPTQCPAILGLGAYTLTTATTPKMRSFYREGGSPTTPCIPSGLPGGPSDLYRYFSPLDANTQVDSDTDRRVQSVSEHDFNCNQKISDSFGHTQMGLEIIDADGKFAGVVLIQSQYNGNPAPKPVYDSIGASYFVLQSINNADPTAHPWPPSS